VFVYINTTKNIEYEKSRITKTQLLEEKNRSRIMELESTVQELYKKIGLLEEEIKSLKKINK
jgi:hypothetical protein